MHPVAFITFRFSSWIPGDSLLKFFSSNLDSDPFDSSVLTVISSSSIHPYIHIYILSNYLFCQPRLCTVMTPISSLVPVIFRYINTQTFGFFFLYLKITTKRCELHYSHLRMRKLKLKCCHNLLVLRE